MARQEGDSVPYGKQEYSAVMKGMFSLDLNQVGTFFYFITKPAIRIFLSA